MIQSPFRKFNYTASYSLYYYFFCIYSCTLKIGYNVFSKHIYDMVRKFMVKHIFFNCSFFYQRIYWTEHNTSVCKCVCFPRSLSIFHAISSSMRNWYPLKHFTECILWQPLSFSHEDCCKSRYGLTGILISRLLECSGPLRC